MLYDLLHKREENLREQQMVSAFLEEDEETRDRINRIREYLVATVIMDTTRNLSEEKRHGLKAY